MARKPTYEELEQRVRELEKETVERNRVEEALKESEEFSSTLLNNSPNPILVINPDTSVRYVNPALEKLTGFSSAEILGRKAPYPWWTEETLQETSVDLTKAMHKGAQKLEELFQKKNGERFWVEITSTPMKKNAEFKFYLANWVKTTERKRAEEALRESETQKRAILDGSIDRIRLVDVDMRIVWANKTTTRELKKTPEDLVGQSCYKVFVGKDTPCAECPAKKAVQSGQIEHAILHQPYSKGIEGETYWDSYAVPIKDESGDIVNMIQVARNITELKIAEEEKKKLEAQFQAAQRMEAMGNLAGGIAHNFNNILMGIQGNTSLVLLNKTSEHPDYERLKGIEQGVKSVAELTRQLLGFARGGKYEVKPTHLNELIENQNRMFGRTKKEITVRGKYEESLWTAEVDQGQIDQVLLNLYVNAWQAMPAGGDLYIQTENVTLDENYTKPFNMEPGRYAKISVTDTGVGMDEATQQRIFDPFFTTKEMGRGTGLVLASVYGIIKNHGGIINVYSEKGEGTTFNIYLPTSEKEGMEEEELPEELLKGTETILLVDDEDMIIDVGQGMLKALGYTVLVARGGKEAIELYRANKDNIDMVILDRIMPQIDGGKAYDRMKKINPDIKVLLSSGYSINGQAEEILDRGCDGFIQKPFNMRQFSKKIREILDS